MSTYEQIKNLLISSQIKFEEIIHDEIITSEEASRVREGITMHEGAKSLIVKFKQNSVKKFANIVVCGDKKFDGKLLRKILNCSEISFATPEEVKEITNGVQVGGVPPFGNLFNLDVYADENIQSNKIIAFSAGTRFNTFIMNVDDWIKVVNPQFYKLY